MEQNKNFIPLFEEVEKISIVAYEEEKNRFEILSRKSEQLIKLCLTFITTISAIFLYITKLKEILDLLLMVLVNLYFFSSLLLSFSTQNVEEIKAFPTGDILLDDIKKKVTLSQTPDFSSKAFKMKVDLIRYYSKATISLEIRNNKIASRLSFAYYLFYYSLILAFVATIVIKISH